MIDLQFQIEDCYLHGYLKFISFRLFVLHQEIERVGKETRRVPLSGKRIGLGRQATRK